MAGARFAAKVTSWSFCMVRHRFVRGQRLVHHRLRLADNRVEMRLVLEAFGVELVDGLGPGGPRREPTAPGDDFNAVDRGIVAGCMAELGENRLAGQRRRPDRLRRYQAQPRLLL